MIYCEAFAFNSFQVNTCIVWDDDSMDCLVVDPSFYGPAEQKRFENILHEKELDLKGQINTHCHVDHLLGVSYVKNVYGLPFRAHGNESGLLASAPVMGELFGWSVDPIEGIDKCLEEDERIMVGDSCLRPLLVPGHSPGSLAFYSEDGGFVITGDALFRGSIGRTDLPGGNFDTLIASIREKLLVLPPETRVIPGHGPASTIGQEIANNPYLTDF